MKACVVDVKVDLFFSRISMAVTKPSEWFFVQLFPSISSVSAEK